MRAYAILAVVYGHAFELVKEHISQNLHFVYLLPIWDGVTLFFALSGFLIGRIILEICTSRKPTAIDLARFWTLRWLRTVPPYLVVLSLLVLLHKNTAGTTPATHEWGKYYLFLQNLNWPHPDGFAEAWSLAVEEWFYLLAPVGFWLVYRQAKSPQAAALAYVLGIIGAGILYHITIYIGQGLSTFDQWGQFLRTVVLARLDSIMFGVLAAYVYHYHRKLWQQKKTLFLCAGIALLVADKIIFFQSFGTQFGTFYLSVFNLTATPLGFALLLPYFSGINPDATGKWRLTQKTITCISKISYSLYLVNHTLVREIVFGAAIFSTKIHDGRSALDAMVVYALYWAASFLAAAALWRAIEMPVMALREKIKQRFARHETSGAAIKS
ncbi:MAG: acyltransferase, partial [Burkholderiaceae bacterium]|nr:acyltransferase [Burkholderiaceae bacterium]